MSHNPIVSVIIPTYNSATTLVRALKSVFHQTYPHWEIIVIDDGSTDATKQVLEPYIQSGQITYIYQKNAGCGVARNTGITASKGEYVALLDSDDYWHYEKLKEQMHVFQQHPETIVCYTDSYMVDPYSDLIWETMHSVLGKPRSGNILKYLIVHNMITLSSVVIPKKILETVGGFSMKYDLMMFADYDLWLRLAVRGKFYAITTPLTFYQTRVIASKQVVVDNYEKILKMFLLLVKNEKNLGIKIAYITGYSIHFFKMVKNKFIVLFEKK